MALLILLIGVIFNISVVLLVSPKIRDRTVRWLISVSCAFVLWQIANYFADRNVYGLVGWNQIAFLAPLLVLMFSYFFVVSLINLKISHIRKYFLIVGTLIYSVLCLTPLVVQGVAPRLNDAGLVVGYNPVYGYMYYGYIVWVVVLVVFFGLAMKNGARSGSEKLRTQVKIIRTGAMIAVSMAILTNVALPQITGSSFSSQFAPLASVVYMTAFVYAILKHGLFDIRPTIARVIAYSFSILTLAAIYGFVVFGISKYVLGLNISLGVHAFLAFTTGIAAITFQIILKNFNKISNSIFYQDSYDPQRFLDELNQVLLSTVDAVRLVEGSKEVIARNMKISSCELYITRWSSGKMDKSESAVSAKLKTLDTVTLRSNRNIISTDDTSSIGSEGQKFMSENSITMISRLCPDLGDRNRVVGYLVLGAKKSGYGMNRGDVEIISNVSNELAIAIQNAQRFDEINNFNVVLQKKVESATSSLRKSNDKLRQIDETKDEFISMASHQLRTPLTAVKGYVSMVLDGDAGELTPGQRKMLGQAFTSSQRMSSLISDLLNVSRLRTGKFIIEPSRVNLVEVIEGEIAQLKETAAGRGLLLTFDKPAHFPVCMLDETKTRQVVMNFMDNAVYYTRPGGKITVQLVENKDSIEFTVTDNGIGVPASEQPHLFTKFYRADNARKARPDGTGLGLFMAKKVVVAQGGAIIFKSVEGHGSIFGFTFPKAKIIQQ